MDSCYLIAMIDREDNVYFENKNTIRKMIEELVTKDTEFPFLRSEKHSSY